MPPTLNAGGIFVNDDKMIKDLSIAVLLVVVGASTGLMYHLAPVKNAWQSSVELAQAGATGCMEDAALTVGILSVAEAQELMADGAYVLDARPQGEYAMGHIDGAINVPATVVDSVLPTLSYNVPKDSPVVVYCRGVGCNDSTYVGQCLLEEGFRSVYVMKGGYPGWIEKGAGVKE